MNRLKKSLSDSSPKSFTISEITRLIYEKIETIGNIWVVGEISNLKYHGSGHVYLTLKDKLNQLNAVIWRKTAQKIKSTMKDGMEVLVSGEINVYGPQSKYQLSIDTLEPRGVGILLIAFENLKKKLARAGLFDIRHKKSLPFLPKTIALVTSPTGAAVQDMLNVVIRRFPNVNILIHPVRVQGDGAALEIVEALSYLRQHRPEVDVIILGRGGGSLEDLWAFNEECVAHAIFACPIPIISAVGHEIDLTISDMVSDQRALTPTEAGEFAVPRLDQLQQQLQVKQQQLQLAILNKIKSQKAILERLATHRVIIKPLERLRYMTQQLDHFQRRLDSAMQRHVQHAKIKLSQKEGKLLQQQPALRIQRYRQHLENLSQRFNRSIAKQIESRHTTLRNLNFHLRALSPLQVLKRGYSISYDYSGKKIIRSHKQAQAEDLIWSRLEDSWLLSRVVKTGAYSK